MSRKTTGTKSARVLPRKQGRTVSKDEQIKQLKSTIKRYEARLELDYVIEHKPGPCGVSRGVKRKLTEEEKLTFPDGISCRAGTIHIMENEILELEMALDEITAYINDEMRKTLSWDPQSLPEELRPIYYILQDNDRFNVVSINN